MNKLIIDGAKYDGEWKNNMAHGKGRFYHTDGDIYFGEWKFDKVSSKFQGQFIWWHLFFASDWASV